MSQCRACHRRVHWVITLTGKKMPIEPDPAIDHLFIGRGEVLYDPKRMKSHFAVCPAADQFRKPKGVKQ